MEQGARGAPMCFQGYMARTGFVCAVAMSTLVVTSIANRLSAEQPHDDKTEGVLPTDVLVAPQVNILHIQDYYPASEVRKNGEGWTLLDMMVDPKGKAFEVTVESSSGNKTIDAAAVKAVEEATNKPGLLNGQPIESSSKLRIVFELSDYQPAASPDFVESYKALGHALEEKDRTTADALMKKLVVRNLYEDAYFGLATYRYARVWGDDRKQLEGLDRAIAEHDGGHKISEIQIVPALQEELRLQIKLRNYSGAVATWDRLRKLEMDPATAAKISAMMDQIARLSSDNTEYDVPGSMPDGLWVFPLYKRNFRVGVTEGHVSDVKLRCGKGFVRFAFDQTRKYTVEPKYGECTIELDGTPGTKINLTQF
jgi:TonB family protein